MSDTVFFVSDTHFKYHSAGKKEREKRRLFLSFLESCSGASRVYLLGDIFDFWFEYRSAAPLFYFDILQGLFKLAGSGTKIFMTGGNHDYWLGDFLPRVIGVEILEAETTESIQGHMITMTHGDMLLPGDHGYKLLKTLIRSRFAIGLAKVLPPDLLYAFAGKVSKMSKSITHKKTEFFAESVSSIAKEKFFNNGNDIFIMGHVHLPIMRHFDDKSLIILGDWVEHASYLRLEDGVFSLESYQRDGKRLIEKR
ncbi:MAG: UDP-2,3-diacylglucosamine diphosphatase [Candidatus Krumholzibacteriota bacterium]|nr:UDP-2,3-diacylglucosamine diphosphatase [Candidatus Krumholzibacteriota bacterium]